MSETLEPRNWPGCDPCLDSPDGRCPNHRTDHLDQPLSQPSLATRIRMAEQAVWDAHSADRNANRAVTVTPLWRSMMAARRTMNKARGPAEYAAAERAVEAIRAELQDLPEWKAFRHAAEALRVARAEWLALCELQSDTEGV